MPLHLSPHDRRLLRGDAGDGAARGTVLVADEFHGRPVLVVPGGAHASFRTGEVVTIVAGGRITRS